jgi:hypothetical protein
VNTLMKWLYMIGEYISEVFKYDWWIHWWSGHCEIITYTIILIWSLHLRKPLHQCIHLSYLTTSSMYSPIIFEHFTNVFTNYIWSLHQSIWSLHQCIHLSYLTLIMCQSGVTCLPADCCWCSTKRTSSSSHWKLTCSCHDIDEKLLNWH